MFFSCKLQKKSGIFQRYEQSNGALIFQIQKQLFSLTQGSDDFSTYFTKIKRIWDELKTIHEIPNCSCGSTAAINKFLEEQRLVQLLMGLNDLFKAIKGQILMMSPLPSISTVHSLLIHEERQREISAAPNLLPILWRCMLTIQLQIINHPRSIVQIARKLDISSVNAID